MEEIERIRRAYYLEERSIREIARTLGHGRSVIRRAIASPDAPRYRMQQPRTAPVLGLYKARIDELLVENKQLPKKQRYTSHKIFELLQQEGYIGSESSVRSYVAERRKILYPKPTFLPLEFDPGQDSQMDWGDAKVDMAGKRITVQVFILRLNYSRAKFVMAFPFQKQEAFFDGHVKAFDFFGGIPHRITYDNLKTAVYRVLAGRKRLEQQHFIAFRSHYLFESVYCTPGRANQKGGVENDVGFARRNFLVPIPEVDSFAELNALLHQRALAEMARQVDRQQTTIGEAFAVERTQLLPLPKHHYPCCVSKPVKANGYSQVSFESNRYSVPTAYAGRPLLLRAFPFRVEILAMDKVVATHDRCFGKKQDVLEPLHYLSLLEQRPGAFDHAKPIRQWRASWPPVYEQVLADLRHRWPDGRGIREFVRILKLQRQHPADMVDKAVKQAVELGCMHHDGVVLCLNQLLRPEVVPASLDLAASPQLAEVGQQPLDLTRYNQLLAGGE